MSRGSIDPAPAPTPWRVRAWATATVCHAVLLLVATHHPKPQDLLGRRLPSDKLMHAASYAILAALAGATLAAAGRLTPRMAAAAALGLAVFAAADEVTQPLFGRSTDPADWVADVVGIACGLLFAAVVARLFARRQ